MDTSIPLALDTSITPACSSMNMAQEYNTYGDIQRAIKTI